MLFEELYQIDGVYHINSICRSIFELSHRPQLSSIIDTATPMLNCLKIQMSQKFVRCENQTELTADDAKKRVLVELSVV